MKRIISRSALATGLCLFGNAFARTAAAEPSATDKSTAAQLFEEGRALLEDGHVDQACPKLEESQRLDPGGGTLLNVALCHERQGRTATAWVEFVEARGVAKADDRPLRVAFAQSHIAALEPMLSRLVVQIPGASDVPDLEIKRDGSVVGRAAWGSALAIDPGDHVIEAAAPGKIAWRQSVVVAAGGATSTVVVPLLRDAPQPVVANVPVQAAPTSPPALGAEAPAPASAGDSSVRTGSPALTTGAWIALGLGAAGAGVATYFGLHAMSLKNDADRECPGDACSAQGASNNHDAIQSADISTGAAAVGVVGLGVGAVLLVMGASNHPLRSARSQGRPTFVACDVSGGGGRGELTVRGIW